MVQELSATEHASKMIKISVQLSTKHSFLGQTTTIQTWKISCWQATLSSPPCLSLTTLDATGEEYLRQVLDIPSNFRLSLSFRRISAMTGY